MEINVKEICDALIAVKDKIIMNTIVLRDADVINNCVYALQNMVVPEPTMEAADLAGVGTGITIGTVNIYIPPTFEQNSNKIPNGVGTILSNSNEFEANG